MWEVEYTDQFEDWWYDLSEDDQEKITSAIDVLQQRGPALGRPLVGEVAGSTIHNLKELIPRGTDIRILFVFDPRRTAILLVGAHKAQHGWNHWYDRIGKPEAERLYAEHLDEIRKEEKTE